MSVLKHRIRCTAPRCVHDTLAHLPAPMFYSCSPHTPPPRPPNLNAISSQTHIEKAERRQRHLSVCQEIIDLGMKLTRAAAQRALDAAEDEAHPSPAHPSAREQPPRRARRDPDLAFHRLSRGVLQAVTLEAKVAAGAFDRAPASRAAAAASTQSDARFQDLCHAVDRSLVSEGLERLTETHPDRWALQDTIKDIVGDSLDGHPEDPLPVHFARACKALGLTPTLDGFPDYLAEALHPETPGWRTPDG